MGKWNINIKSFFRLTNDYASTNPLTTNHVSFRLILIMFTGYEEKSRRCNDYREPCER